MARQPIKNVDKYRRSLTNTEPIAGELAKIAKEVGLGCCGIGPYYMPPWKQIREYKFSLGIVQPTSVDQVKVMRWLAINNNIKSYMIKFDGDHRHLTDLVTLEKLDKSHKELQQLIMAKVAEDNPKHPFDPATMTDDSTAGIRQFTRWEQAETDKLLLYEDCQLDYTIRSLPSDNITKLDIDVVFFDPKTYRIKLLAETKMHWVDSNVRMNYSITKKLGDMLKVPAGLVFIEGEPRYEGRPYGCRGFDIEVKETAWDLPLSALKSFIERQLEKE